MNTPTNDLTAGFTVELRAFLALCDEAFDLVSRESRALAAQTDYQPGEFDQRRKNLLPDLESALIKLRRRRQLWQQTRSSGGALSEDVKALFQAIQGLLMRVLLIDRENQQAMLRRGMVPARHLPPAQAQRPHYVAGLYRRHAAS